MSILILSLLLLLLVGIGALMGRRITAIERFQDKHPATTEDVSDNKQQQTFQITGTVNVDPLARDIAVQDAVVEGGKKSHLPKPAPNPTPAPPTPAPNPEPAPPKPAPHSACPDMSQYIRMDEIPCWNCTLP